MDGWMDGRLFAVQLSGASVWSAHRPGNSRVAHHWRGLAAAASHYRSSITHVVRPVMNRAGCLPRGESLVKQKKLMTRFCNAAKTVTDCLPLNGLKLNPRHSSAARYLRINISGSDGTFRLSPHIFPQRCHLSMSLFTGCGTMKSDLRIPRQATSHNSHNAQCSGSKTPHNMHSLTVPYTAGT